MSVTVYIAPKNELKTHKVFKDLGCNHKIMSIASFIRLMFYMKFTILPCPPGFILLDNPPRYDCYSVFTETLNVTCQIINGAGFLSWTSDLWMNLQENVNIYSEYCPHDYCKKGI